MGARNLLRIHFGRVTDEPETKFFGLYTVKFSKSENKRMAYAERLCSDTWICLSWRILFFPHMPHERDIARMRNFLRPLAME